MCNSPNMLADKTMVACRKCGQCRSNRIDEWVGRCIAESKTCVATTSITLTYGRDEDGNESHARAAILTYSDVQKYFKQLRKRGFPCRYLMTGEHGSKKGRAHWHGIVFWLEDVPNAMLDYGCNSWHRPKRDVPVEVPIEWNTRFNEPCWVHGYSFWQPVTFGHEKGSIAYACKYINKDIDDPTAQSKLAMSKLPPIGSAYFIERAQKFVDARIAPQDPFYQFTNQAKRKNGNAINFMLRGKLKEIFCTAFIDKWAEQVGGHPPPSEFLEDHSDRLTRADWDRRAAFAPSLSVPDNRWTMQPPFGFDKEAIHFVDDAPAIKTETGYLYYGPNKEGIKGWREEIPEKITPPPSRGGGFHCAQQIAQSTLSQSEWVRKLAERHVFWISIAVTSLGRYRLAKMQPATGRRVWLRSLNQ